MSRSCTCTCLVDISYVRHSGLTVHRPPRPQAAAAFALGESAAPSVQAVEALAGAIRAARSRLDAVPVPLVEPGSLSRRRDCHFC